MTIKEVINMTKNELYHHGVKGMKWGVRRYQNYDGSYTRLGKEHRYSEDHKEVSSLKKKDVRELNNDELRKINQRDELVSKYKQKNPSKINKGLKYVATTTATMGSFLALYNTGSQVIKIGKRFVYGQ